MIYLFITRFPRLGQWIAGLIPVVNAQAFIDANARHGPLIVTAAHFGPLWLESLVTFRFVRGRNLYVIHAKDHFDVARTTRFLDRFGAVSLTDDEQGLRALLRATRDDPKAAILLAFDHAAGARRTMPFLAMTLPVSAGIGFIADALRCPTVLLFWEWNRLRPSVTVSGVFTVDESLPPRERRAEFVERMYRMVERQVRRAPEQWIEWETMAEPVASAAS